VFIRVDSWLKKMLAQRRQAAIRLRSYGVTRRKNHFALNYFAPNLFTKKLVSISADQWLKINR